MNKLICFTGLTGSGKTIAAEYFIKKGYQYIRFGQVVLDEVIRRRLLPTEDNERPIREEFRKKYGMAAIAKLNLKNFKRLLTKGNVVGDGLYSFEEYKYLKRIFGRRLVTVAVFTSPKERYKRLKRRSLLESDKKLKKRPSTPKMAKSRDYSELQNLNKGATIAMADHTILNTGSLSSFTNQLDKLERILR